MNQKIMALYAHLKHTRPYESGISYITCQAIASSYYSLAYTMYDPIIRPHFPPLVKNIMPKRNTSIPKHDPLMFKG